MSIEKESRTQARLVAGIDEAGLGPLLGPLTLGFSVMRLPPKGKNVWDALDSIVGRQPSQDASHIIVADSKKVYSRNPRGRRRLETTALGFLAQRAVGGPVTGADLLRCAPEEFRPRAAEVARHPWYEKLPKHLPVWTDPGRLELRSEALRRELEAFDLAVVDAGVRLIPAGELNRSFDRTQNKSATVWSMVGSILRYLWEQHGHQGVHVIVDRQGGRFRYGQLLRESFPGVQVQVGKESPDHSEYRLESDPALQTRSSRMRLTFAEKAEDRAFTVALGSCLAKYARELAMEAFNGYFQALQPGLAPTAGYTTDGRRWVQDAAGTLDRNQIDREVLIRRR
jgi:ribonuclease HII